MANDVDPLPDEMSLKEAGEFWDSHSVADYPTQTVQFDVEPGDRKTFVAIEQHLLEELERRAKESGISVETLVNLWIQEKVAHVR